MVLCFVYFSKKKNCDCALILPLGFLSRRFVVAMGIHMNTEVMWNLDMYYSFKQ